MTKTNENEFLYKYSHAMKNNSNSNHYTWGHREDLMFFVDI